MNIENYLNTAKGKINNKWQKTIILSILAGFFIGTAAILSTIVSFKIENYSVAKILSGCVFPIGLILVILLKTELFTGNSLLVIPLLERKIKIKQLLKNWLLVYIGNFIGSLLLAILIYYTPLKDTLGEAFIKISNTKVSLEIYEALILGFLCNIFVCLAVYLSSIVSTAVEKILVIFIPIFTFILLSLEHSIANMFYLSFGYLVNTQLTISDILLRNLLPVTIGNIIGGSLIGLIIWYLSKKDN